MNATQQEPNGANTSEEAIEKVREALAVLTMAATSPPLTEEGKLNVTYAALNIGAAIDIIHGNELAWRDLAIDCNAAAEQHLALSEKLHNSLEQWKVLREKFIWQCGNMGIPFPFDFLEAMDDLFLVKQVPSPEDLATESKPYPAEEI